MRKLLHIWEPSPKMRTIAQAKGPVARYTVLALSEMTVQYGRAGTTAWLEVNRELVVIQ